MPSVAIEHDPRLAADELRPRINDLRLPVRKGPGPGGFLANETPMGLAQHGLQAEPAIHPLRGRPAALVRDDEPALAKCREVGIQTWGPHGYASLALANEIYLNAPWLLTAELVDHSLWILRRDFPALVDEARRRFTVEWITEVLRGLVAEGVSIRNLRAIFEGLLAIDGVYRPRFDRPVVLLPSSGNLAPSAHATCIEELRLDDWINVARMALRWQITHEAAPEGTLNAGRLKAEAERRLARAPAEPLSTAERAGLLKAFSEWERDLPPETPRPAIVTNVTTRSVLSELIRHEFPAIRVLSRFDLAPTVKTQLLGRIAWVPNRTG
jgi:type III secretion protein V